MKKLTKIIAATGIVAGLGVAGLPLVSYADNTASTDANVSVKLKVSDTISIASSGNIDFDTLVPDHKTDGSHYTTLTVISNSASGYTVTASGTPLKRSEGDTNAIPFGNVSTGTSNLVSAYGIALSNSGSFTTMQGENIMSEDAPSTVTGDTEDVYFAASVSASQPTGEYNGTVTFTATNK